MNVQSNPFWSRVYQLTNFTNEENKNEESLEQITKKQKRESNISLEQRDVESLKQMDVESFLKEIDRFFDTHLEADAVNLAGSSISKLLFKKIQKEKILSSVDQLLSLQFIKDHETGLVYVLNGFEKELLLQQSPVFRSLWLGKFKEAQSSEISLENGKGLKILIESHYLPKVLSNCREDILDLLHAARFYQLIVCERLLKKEWKHLLKECLAEENLESSAMLLQFAKDFDSELWNTAQKILNDYLEKSIFNRKVFNERVQKLQNWLTEYHFHGRLDDNLAILPKLEDVKKLNLASYDEAISDEKLLGLCQLPLESLNLHGIKMNEKTFSTLLLKLPLKELILFDFDFAGRIQASRMQEIGHKKIEMIQKKSSLESLAFWGTGKLTLDDFQVLKKMSRLQRLNMSLLINNSHLQDLEGLPVEKLELREKKSGKSYQDSDEAIEKLKNKNLKSLRIDCHKMTDEGLKHLQDFSLESLELNNLQITDNGCQYLNKSSLKSLVIHNCKKITGLGFKHLKGSALKSLRWYKKEIPNFTFLRGMYLESLTLNSEKKLRKEQLEDLEGASLKLTLGVDSLSQTSTLESLALLKKSPLEKLSFSGCYQAGSDEELKYLEGVSIKSLRLDFNLITAEALHHLKDMPLEELILVDATDEALEKLKGLSLISLTFRYCPRITDKALSYLKDMPLKELRLENCAITGSGFEDLQNLSLNYLGVTDCPITDECLKYLNEMPLKKIFLGRCPITGQGFQYLQNLCLESLNILGCPFTDEGYQYLKKMEAKVKYIYR